jgi:hypothetical protein
MALGREDKDDIFVDMAYFDHLESEARAAIEQFGSYLDLVI